MNGASWQMPSQPQPTEIADPAEPSLDTDGFRPNPKRLGGTIEFVRQHGDAGRGDYLNLEFDGGMRFGDHLEVGAVAGLGFGVELMDSLSDVPDDILEIGGASWRLGPQFRYYLNADSRLQPWFGGGIGVGSARDDFLRSFGGLSDFPSTLGNRSEYWFWKIGIGASYFVTESAAFELAFWRTQVQDVEYRVFDAFGNRYSESFDFGNTQLLIGGSLFF